MGQVIGYARLSSAEQATGQTLEQQIDRLERAGATEVLVDLMPGTSTARPKYRELLRRVEAGIVSKVIATRLDRLCRSASETCRLVDLFATDGAPELTLLDDPAEMSTIGGRLKLRLVGVMAQTEVERLRERSMAGKRYRKAKGCADVAPFGMFVRPDGLLEPDEREFLCVLEGQQELSRAAIARELFSVIEKEGAYAGWRTAWERYGLIFDRAGVSRWALNPSLRGARVRGRSRTNGQNRWSEIREGANAPLIEPERHIRFEAAARGRKARGGRNDTRRKHPLSSKLVCGHCGKRLVRKLVNRGLPRYSCPSQSCSYRIPGERCNSISEAAAMAKVCKSMAEASPQIAQAIEQGTGNSDLQPLKAQLTTLIGRRDRYLAMLAEGEIEIQSAINQVEQKIADLNTALMVPRESGGTLNQFRQQIREGLKNNPELGFPLQQLADKWSADGNVVAVWVAMFCLAGTQAWLQEETHEEARRWIDYWVHTVTVTEKAPTVQLNLSPSTAVFSATP